MHTEVAGTNSTSLCIIIERAWAPSSESGEAISPQTMCVYIYISININTHFYLSTYLSIYLFICLSFEFSSTFFRCRGRHLIKKTTYTYLSNVLNYA